MLFSRLSKSAGIEPASAGAENGDATNNWHSSRKAGTQNFMKISTPMALIALAVLLTSCATTKPPQAFHNSDNGAVVIDSLDTKTTQMLQPASTVRQDNDTVLARAMNLSRHQTAVVTLENDDESQVGLQYRIRGTPWFVGLRGLGYEHIVFLQGRGVTNPEGLITLTEYF